ncbi:MAG: YigZ family protein [Oscillospiraceae bacterium]|jgi:uncharacterized YigZ family protein|nr:YigZ family protein [Oscillospiraceae bacterium]
MSDEAYRVPRGPGEAVFAERRSRFIGRVRPVRDEAEALAFLQEIRAGHWDATHNVYAYLLREGNLTRYSDDGEPQGTAGLPVLDVLRHAGVYDAICVVTRYFGGVLLGTGGLVRAYARAAREALDAAGLATMQRWTRLTLSCPYPLLTPVRREITAAGGVEESLDYAADVSVALWMPAPLAGAFVERITDLTAGRVTPAAGEEAFRALGETV